MVRLSQTAAVLGLVLAAGLAGAAALAVQIDPAPGEALARKHCASCHAIGAGKSRINAPTFPEIAKNPATTETSLNFLLTHPHKTMPSLQLSSDERTSMIAYILSLRPPAK
jgi:mono/diheme cytochrome c family protein